MRYEMFEMKQYYTLGSVDSNTRLIQNNFGTGSGINLESEQFLMSAWFQMWNRF